MRLRTKRKAEIVDALGGACIECGETRLAALTLHHPLGLTRSTERGTVLWRKPWTEETWNEAIQCHLLCANCHQVEHSELDDMTAGEVLYVSGWHGNSERNDQARITAA